MKPPEEVAEEILVPFYGLLNNVQIEHIESQIAAALTAERHEVDALKASILESRKRLSEYANQDVDNCNTCHHLSDFLKGGICGRCRADIAESRLKDAEKWMEHKPGCQPIFQKVPCKCGLDDFRKEKSCR